MVGGGYCQLQKPLKLALAARETVAGYRGTGGVPLPLRMHPCRSPTPATQRR